MAFWSSQTLKDKQLLLKDLITPFNPDRVEQGAYEMCLSDEVLTTPPHTPGNPGVVDGVLMIEPGQFGVLYTAETVHIPDDVIAFISIKASVKFHGLVNISGFHVDPGYHSRLKFSVYNAATEVIALEIGQPAFLIWFSDLDKATDDPYDKTHQHLNQTGITPQDRVRMRNPAASPAALDQRLKTLEERWRIFVGISTYFVLPMIVALVAGIVVWLLTILIPRSDALQDTESPKYMNQYRIMPTASPLSTAPRVEQSAQSPPPGTEAATTIPTAPTAASTVPTPSAPELTQPPTGKSKSQPSVRPRP